MPQPIPKKIQQNNPDFAEKSFNTLLVDGSNLLELSFKADKRLSGNGKARSGRRNRRNRQRPVLLEFQHLRRRPRVPQK